MPRGNEACIACFADGPRAVVWKSLSYISDILMVGCKGKPIINRKDGIHSFSIIWNLFKSKQ